MPSGFLTVRLGGSGGASVFLGSASGLTSPCGPPASGGASCEGGCCCCCCEPACGLADEEPVCPEIRELENRNKAAISRERANRPFAGTGEHLKHLEKFSECLEIPERNIQFLRFIEPQNGVADANIDAPKSS